MEKSGDEVFRLHPHAVFDKISRNGHWLTYRDDVVEGGLFVFAWVNGNPLPVGKADFYGDEGCFRCQSVEVDEAYRRRGIANALYVFAEKVTGRILFNWWKGKGDQTELAKALWAQPNRPFGNPEDT
jgi:GNAT superfamily N-acetyltransferase